MRKIFVALVAVALMTMAAAPAAAQYPPNAPTCTITITFDPLTITIVCNGFAPNNTVIVTMFSEPTVLGTATTDAEGNVTESFPIPEDAEPGDHTLRVSGLAPSGAVESVSAPAASTDAPVEVEAADSGAVEPVDVDLAFTLPEEQVIAPASLRSTSTTAPWSGPGAPLIALAAGVGLLAVAGGALTVARRRSGAASDG